MLKGYKLLHCFPPSSSLPPQKNFAPTTYRQLRTSTELRPVGDVSAMVVVQLGLASLFSDSLIQRFAWEEMGTNRSTTEEIDVNSDVVDEVVCLSDDGNLTTPTQVDGSETAAAVETQGTPKKGMTFDSLEALEKFYSSYGNACAFGVIRVEAKKDGNTNVKRWQYWHCECGPRTSTNQVVKEGDPKGAEVQPCKRRRKSKQCGCEAGIVGYLNKDGLWEIHKDLMDVGVKQSQIYHALANQMNGFENLPYLLKDMHNVVGKERSKEFDKTDCRAMFEYFAKMKEVNEDFFFSWRIDKANKLMDVLGGIITDQSVPMAKAIQQVLPGSRHRLCVWHILSKVPRKLPAVKKVGEVHKKMKDVVYDSLSIEESECR
ncbi:Protein FAR1-RELATED SEQUENCE 1 [Bienertia sinuspersici]